MSTLKILVRLPNWLGDMVMAVGFMQQMQTAFPDAEISVIAKKGIHQLLPYFPPSNHQFIFDKAQYKGLAGAWRFGKEIRKVAAFDLFFCLPDSFSSAWMGWASGAGKRIGFAGQLRHFLFTHAYTKVQGLHRAAAYITLLERYSGIKPQFNSIHLKNTFDKKDYVVVNVNSEASSRRLTVNKAVELLALLQQTISEKIIVMGAPKEQEFIHEVLKKLPGAAIENRAGKTTLAQLAALLASAKLLLTTDSGPAHLANALGTYTVVLFGAGNENETAPYNKKLRTVIRLNRLSCEPCQKNVCVRYGTPQCLEQLDSAKIVQEVVTQLNASAI